MVIRLWLWVLVETFETRDFLQTNSLIIFSLKILGQLFSLNCFPKLCLIVMSIIFKVSKLKKNIPCFTNVVIFFYLPKISHFLLLKLLHDVMKGSSILKDERVSKTSLSK